MTSHWIPDKEYMEILKKLNDRDQKIVRLLRFTGYRVDDVLYSRCWQWQAPKVTIKEAKTGKLRTVDRTPAMKLITEALIGDRHILEYLVPTRHRRQNRRKKIHRTTLWRHFEAAVKKCGYDGRGYTLHSLRKCYAVDLLRKTGSFVAVQEDLGHKYLSTTLLYLKDALTLL